MEHFSPSSKNNKNPPCKNFLIFQEMELSDSKIKLEKIHSEKISYILILKKFLKKAFLIFRETETPKKFFIF